MRGALLRLMLWSVYLVGPVCAIEAEPQLRDAGSGLPSEGLSKIFGDERRIESVIVSRDNRIVYEYYRNEGYRDRIFNYYSCTKSITAILTGIAIDEGFIASEDERIGRYFPGIADAGFGKGSITIKDLLTMESGIDWPESTSWNNFFQPMIESDNWIEFILGREMVSEPGAGFNYNTGNYHLISKIIETATKRKLSEYADEKLFRKLGATPIYWYLDPQGLCFGGAWIRMKAKDALKIGELILNEGEYGGQRIVSKGWIDKMTAADNGGRRWSEYTGGDYGYGWWINRYQGKPTVFAWGASEQYIFITPGLSLVAVFNCAYDTSPGKRPPQLYSENIVKRLLR